MMPSIFKSALPFALASPLLLAATPPSQLGSVGAACDWESVSARGQREGGAIAPGNSQYPDRTVTAQPIAHPSGALLNSEQEMTNFARAAAPTSRNRWATAIRLLLNNPYTVDSTPNSPPEQDQAHCITQLTPDQQAAPRGKRLLAQAVSPPPDDASPMTPLPVLDTPPEVPAAVPPAEITVEEVTVEESMPAAVPLTAIDRSPAINPTNITPTTVEPTPFEGTTLSTLAALPDGNYRYISGEADRRDYSTGELSQRGSAVFLLQKEGNRVTGDLLPRVGLPGICVTGLASGNVITGAAYPYDTTDALPDSDRDLGETVEPYGSALQIRRTQQEGNRLYYASAVLDLNNFSRINAGASLPPTQCQTGSTGVRDQR